MGDINDGYTRLILNELERLNENDIEIRKILTDINLKMGKIDSMEKDLSVIEKWKRYMDDVASPNTLKTMKTDVNKLNTFKTVATTIWAVVQVIFGIIIGTFSN